MRASSNLPFVSKSCTLLRSRLKAGMACLETPGWYPDLQTRCSTGVARIVASLTTTAMLYKAPAANLLCALRKQQQSSARMQCRRDRLLLGYSQAFLRCGFCWDYSAAASACTWCNPTQHLLRIMKLNLAQDIGLSHDDCIVSGKIVEPA